MNKVNFFSVILVTASVSGTPSLATGLDNLSQCYTRHYSAAHMQSQPKQNVTDLALEIDAKDKSVVISGTNRDGQFGYDTYSCYENPGSETLDPACMTFEAESQLWIKERGDGSIMITTRNTVLSDIGGTNFEYGDKDEQNGHYVFHLEEARHSVLMGTGPFFSYRLYPAKASACPKIGE
ncbi:MAG TPA: hypothetical protein ENJ91_07390 [Rhodobacteraceae bacterium]|nr:hypothetical protein [Paracoccaceae bacterium]